MLGSKFVKLCCHFETTSQFLNFASFFIFMIYNSSVNFKLNNDLLWIKVSHQSVNFETLECSLKQLSNSSCHFPNHKSVSLHTLHQSSVSWKITPMCFFRSIVIYFAHKVKLLNFDLSTQNPQNFHYDWFKVKILRILSAQVKIHEIVVIFETTNQFFFKFCIILHCHDTQLLYTF